MEPRRAPNILICGTPGTGKSTTAEALAARVPSLRAVDVGALVRDQKLHEGWDDETDSYILDDGIAGNKGQRPQGAAADFVYKHG